MNIRLFIVFLILVFSNTNAQSFKLGNVTIAELEEKSHPIDSTATAAILFNKAKTIFSYDSKNRFSINTENTFRIKIYKKEGLEWANFKVPYYVGYETYNDDTVEFTNCYTYNLENGKIVITKLNNEGIFKTSKNNYWKEIAIALPNVKSGSVIEFKYTMKSENIVEFPDFNFQYTIPVNYSEYETEIPEFFSYKAILKGNLDIKTDAKITRGFFAAADRNSSTRTVEINFEKRNSKYVAQNIPALKSEPYVDNIQNYRSTIFHELEKIQYFQEPAKDYSMTWAGVVQNIYENPDFGDQLTLNGYFEQDLNKIIDNVGSQNEKLEVIFKFVQNKMNWNNRRGYNIDKGVKQAYKEGIGNTADINFILIAMLNASGIKAYPVLLSTIDHGVPQYPNRTIFNYVIAAAEMDGKNILLDATNKHTTQNIIPLNTINWTGRLLRPNGTSQEIKLEPIFSSKKGIFLNTKIDEKGKISGTYRVQRADYEALTFREQYLEINQQNYLEKVENDFSGMQISDYNIENSKDLSKPIIENFTFTADNQSEIIGDKIYINPQLFLAQTKNPFLQEKRELPVYFAYPKQEKYTVNIQIPDGYMVESIPKSIKLETGENVCSFIFKSGVTENGIQILIVKDTNMVLVSSDFYPVLKGYYKQMIDKLDEKIVLKKI